MQYLRRGTRDRPYRRARSHPRAGEPCSRCRPQRHTPSAPRGQAARCTPNSSQSRATAASIACGPHVKTVGVPVDPGDESPCACPGAAIFEKLLAEEIRDEAVVTPRAVVSSDEQRDAGRVKAVFTDHERGRGEAEAGVHRRRAWGQPSLAPGVLRQTNQRRHAHPASYEQRITLRPREAVAEDPRCGDGRRAAARRAGACLSGPRGKGNRLRRSPAGRGKS